MSVSSLDVYCLHNLFGHGKGTFCVKRYWRSCRIGQKYEVEIERNVAHLPQKSSHSFIPQGWNFKFLWIFLEFENSMRNGLIQVSPTGAAYNYPKKYRLFFQRRRVWGCEDPICDRALTVSVWTRKKPFRFFMTVKTPAHSGFKLYEIDAFSS